MKRRLAVAVGAEQRDAVVGVDAQRQLPQHRACPARSRPTTSSTREDRRRQRLVGRGDRDLAHLVLDAARRSAAAWRAASCRDCAWRALVALARKRSTKAVRCLRSASCFLARPRSRASRSLRWRSNVGVVAAIEGQLAALEMQDRVDRGVEQVAVVADDDHGARIARDVVLEPQACLRGRDSWSARRAAGCPARRTARRRARRASASRRRIPRRARCWSAWRKAEAGEDRGGARRRGMRADVGEARLDLGDAVRIARGLGFGEERAALAVGGEHDVEQRLSARRAPPARSRPMLARDGQTKWPCSRAMSPAMARNSELLPVPLRPTRPTRAPEGICADERSIRSRPATRKETSSITSIGVVWPQWR